MLTFSSNYVFYNQSQLYGFRKYIYHLILQRYKFISHECKNKFQSIFQKLCKSLNKFDIYRIFINNKQMYSFLFLIQNTCSVTYFLDIIRITNDR